MLLSEDGQRSLVTLLALIVLPPLVLVFTLILVSDFTLAFLLAFLLEFLLVLPLVIELEVGSLLTVIRSAGVVDAVLVAGVVDSVLVFAVTVGLVFGENLNSIII